MKCNRKRRNVCEHVSCASFHHPTEWRHIGQVLVRRNHSFMHWLCSKCPHGNRLIDSCNWNSIKQIGHADSASTWSWLMVTVSIWSHNFMSPSLDTDRRYRLTRFERQNPLERKLPAIITLKLLLGDDIVIVLNVDVRVRCWLQLLLLTSDPISQYLIYL